MYVTAIVLAAGRGSRFGADVSKLLAEIDSQPVIIYCLKTLSSHTDIRDIILVANPENLRGISSKIKKYRIGKINNLVLGGSLRQDSVTNGLRSIDPRTDLVLIHDGVRPFVDKKILSSSIRAAQIYGAAIVGVPVKATIKEVQSKFIIKKTLNRDELWEVQTPQVFRKDLILQAYKKFGNREVTDDAALVEKLGVKVRVVMGSYFNIKITTPEDLILAEAIIKTQKYSF